VSLAHAQIRRHLRGGGRRRRRRRCWCLGLEGPRRWWKKTSSLGSIRWGNSGSCKPCFPLEF
jgi:hypothetical protein